MAVLPGDCGSLLRAMGIGTGSGLVAAAFGNPEKYGCTLYQNQKRLDSPQIASNPLPRSRTASNCQKKPKIMEKVEKKGLTNGKASAIICERFGEGVLRRAPAEKSSRNLKKVLDKLKKLC